MTEYKEKCAARSGTTGKRFDAVAQSFVPNPAGEAILAARVVAALADMNNYLARTASSGIRQNSTRGNFILIEDTP